MSAEQIATMIPIPTELLEDMGKSDAYAFTWLRLLLQRRLTAEIFGEDWSGPDEEMDRLEHRRTIAWDPRYWPDEFEAEDW